MDEKNTAALQGEIKNLEAERAQLNPNSADDRFRITQIDSRLSELRAQLDEVKAEEQHQQIHEEVQELVLSHDFNGVLGHPDANKIIYSLLYDAKQKHVAELQEQQSAKDGLQEALDMANATIQTLDQEKDQLQESLAAMTAERDKLEEGNELLMNETRSLRNEVARLTSSNKSLHASLEMEKQRQSSFAAPSKAIDELLADAAKTTQERRKVMNLRPADERKSKYTATDEDGNTLTIGWLELGKYEEVDHFPAPPAGDQIAEAQAQVAAAVADPEVTEDDIAAQGHVVDEAAQDAARFQAVPHGDAAGSEAEGGAGEVLGAGDAATEAEGQAPEARQAERIAALEARMARVELTLWGSTTVTLNN